MSLRDLQCTLDPGLTAALEEVARREWLLASIQAQKRQEAMAVELRDGRSLEGLGACQRRVDTFAYHDWALKLGSHACWQDRGFLKYFDRIAPECKVRSRGTKVQVGYTAPARFEISLIERNTPRFRKAYPSPKTESEKARKRESESPHPALPSSLSPLPSSAL